MRDLNKILIVFISLWLVVIGIPLSWWIFPVKGKLSPIGGSPEFNGQVITSDIYSLLADMVYSKEDILDSRRIRATQLYNFVVSFKRDPFSPYRTVTSSLDSEKEDEEKEDSVEKEAVLPGINLEGISYSNYGKIALINGGLLREGERINGVTVIKIQENSVAFERDDEIFVINIKER